MKAGFKFNLKKFFNKYIDYKWKTFNNLINVDGLKSEKTNNVPYKHKMNQDFVGNINQIDYSIKNNIIENIKKKVD